MKKVNIWLMLGILVVGIVVGIIVSVFFMNNMTEDNMAEGKVYVTRTGAKYHRGDCKWLQYSKIPISLEEAKQQYGPCRTCNPPR